MNSFWKGVVVILSVMIVGTIVFFGFTAEGRKIFHEWRYGIEKSDEGSYENQKKVEDTCRAMIASYNQDKLVYEQYKNSDVTEERSWANNAKIRANNTASTYNNYILKNSYVWRNNVPNDIFMTLSYLE